MEIRAITKTLYQAIEPLIIETNKKTCQHLYSNFRNNFFYNYEDLRQKMHSALFCDGDKEKHFLDRHKVAAEVIIVVLSASRYTQQTEFYRKFSMDPVQADIIRYRKYPNEIFAWKAGLTILFNFVLDDLKDRNEEKLAIARKILFPQSSKSLFNDNYIGCFDVCHVGNKNDNNGTSEVQYIDTILMLLNFYNRYSHFNVISVLSLAQILFFYEKTIEKMLEREIDTKNLLGSAQKLPLEA